MKKTIINISLILVLIILSFKIYWNLPIEVTRKSDVEFGNKLIQNIESYQKTNGKLPGNNDWETLEKLGFKKEDLGKNPDYKTDSALYELIYNDGFDGPYLMWNSQEREWTVDYSKINQN